MLIVFFDIKGIVHHEFVPPEQTVHAKFDVFFLFNRIKLPIKDKHFETSEEIQAASTAALKYIPKNSFRDVFNTWKSRWPIFKDFFLNYLNSPIIF